jgi:hypothetical protein
MKRREQLSSFERQQKLKKADTITQKSPNPVTTTSLEAGAMTTHYFPQRAAFLHSLSLTPQTAHLPTDGAHLPPGAVQM